MEDVKRVPVSKEFLAMAVAGKLGDGRDIMIPHRTCVEALYKSVEKMVFGIAIDFSCTSSDEVADLANDCARKLLRVLRKYDARKSRFTTWSYRVCQNHLRTKYGLSKGMRSLVIGMPSQEEGDRPIEPSREYALGISADFIDAISIVRKSSDALGKKIIDDIFGYDATTHECRLPDRVNFAETSRRLNVSSARVSRFFYGEIVPVLAERFGMDVSDELLEKIHSSVFEKGTENAK